MINHTIQKYTQYKASGVEWLGEIPEHWEVKKLKFLLNGKLKYGANQSGVEYNPFLPRYIRITDFGQDGKLSEDNKLSLPWEKGKDYLLKNGDILFARSGATVGKSYQFKTKLSNEENHCYAGYLIKAEMNENLILSDFLYLFSNSEVFNKWRDSIFIKATIENIGADKYSQLPVILPPLSEQQKIAEFLDSKTALIDKAIGIKEKQIELLKERRQIMIHRAVTRGISGLHWDSSDLGISGLASESNIPKSTNQINPDSDIYPKLKPSGVEWIGEIPEHWEVKRLRYVGKCQNGISKGGEYFGSGFPFVSYGDVYKSIVLPIEVNGLAESSESDRIQYSVIEGDVFFTRTSETVQEIGFASTCLKTIRNATFAGFLIRFRPQNSLLYKGFSKYYFSSKTHRSFFVKEMNLVIRASLSQELLNRMPVLLPPFNEQIEISNYLETLTKKIATAISYKEQEIEKLKEYKSVLINSAVTGKVRV